jgi:hypothetical protein
LKDRFQTIWREVNEFAVYFHTSKKFSQVRPKTFLPDHHPLREASYAFITINSSSGVPWKVNGVPLRFQG